MKLRLTLTLGLFLTALSSSAALAEFNGKPCQCRYQGGKVDEGTVMCITTPEGSKLMLCEMVLNNPAWRPIQNGCAVGQLHQTFKLINLTDAG